MGKKRKWKLGQCNHVGTKAAYDLGQWLSTHSQKRFRSVEVLLKVLGSNACISTYKWNMLRNVQERFQ